MRRSWCSLFALLSFAGACDSHKYYTVEQLDQIEVGMSEEQLLAIMGSPYSEDEQENATAVWVYEGEQDSGMFNDPLDAYRVVVRLVDGRVAQFTVENEHGERVR